jgi:predicted XRE-type DNA-binding protein
VRVLQREGMLWNTPLRVSQQAVEQRLNALPASLFHAVLQDILPRMQQRWHERERPLPPELAWAQQQYHCRACGVYTVTDDRARERAITMELVEKLHRERVSQRGIARVTGISRPTIVRWLRKKVLRPIGATILPTATRPEIEIDEQ